MESSLVNIRVTLREINLSNCKNKIYNRLIIGIAKFKLCHIMNYNEKPFLILIILI